MEERLVPGLRENEFLHAHPRLNFFLRRGQGHDPRFRFRQLLVAKTVPGGDGFHFLVGTFLAGHVSVAVIGDDIHVDGLDDPVELVDAVGGVGPAAVHHDGLGIAALDGLTQLDVVVGVQGHGADEKADVRFIAKFEEREEILVLPRHPFQVSAGHGQVALSILDAGVGRVDVVGQFQVVLPVDGRGFLHLVVPAIHPVMPGGDAAAKDIRAHVLRKAQQPGISVGRRQARVEPEKEFTGPGLAQFGSAHDADIGTAADDFLSAAFQEQTGRILAIGQPLAFDRKGQVRRPIGTGVNAAELRVVDFPIPVDEGEEGIQRQGLAGLILEREGDLNRLVGGVHHDDVRGIGYLIDADQSLMPSGRFLRWRCRHRGGGDAGNVNDQPEDTYPGGVSQGGHGFVLLLSF